MLLRILSVRCSTCETRACMYARGWKTLVPTTLQNQYVHSKGICHADMSLENTLVNSAHT
ncbi:unnamed protein product, partial [Ectocarpus sp. 12 AP-2014]